MAVAPATSGAGDPPLEQPVAAAARKKSATRVHVPLEQRFARYIRHRYAALTGYLLLDEPPILGAEAEAVVEPFINHITHGTPLLKA